MYQMRKAGERGQTSLSWLDSQHTFSFGDYFDPRHRGVSALRVLNDDRVRPGAGFGTHGHRDMEILTYVTEGAIVHEDSAGHREEVPAGEFQLMHAGKGIYHSEFNASQDEQLRFLQIWIMPDELGGRPGYEQKRFARVDGLQLIASRDGGDGCDGADGSLTVRQDVKVWRAVLAAGAQCALPVVAPRIGYLHLVSGALETGGLSLGEADGVAIGEESLPRVTATATAEFLFFDLPAVTAAR
ncbi:MAG: pirin family protein [Gammaproteobacteria bacterium]